MENLDLRKAVAKALGCKPKKFPGYPGDLEELFCNKAPNYSGHTPHIIKSYDLDHHAASDALEEYTRKAGLDYDISRRGKKFKVTIYTDDGIWVTDKTIAIAICKAIEVAAQKSEKEEAGE